MAERIELGEGLLHRTLTELRRCGEVTGSASHASELPQTLEDAFLARLEADGSWTGVDPITILGGACR